MMRLFNRNLILKFVLIPLISMSISVADTSCKETYGSNKNIFKLATGSPGELGLLKVIAEKFNERNNSSLCWVKAGSGKSLKLLKDRKVDIIMVHAPLAEEKAVNDGWAIKRNLLGSNEFYIVGPKNDPADIKNAKTVVQAYSFIAKKQAKFLSRGDNSGTNKKELAIWEKAGIQTKGDWYKTTKDFMMASLKQADKESGYFMTDSSTWVAGKKEIKNLKVLFKGDSILVNHYHVLVQPVGATVNQKIASKFVDFLISNEGQKIISEYGIDKYFLPMYKNARDTK